MDESDVARFFTRSDGSYLFARWGRPIVPLVFGVDDATLALLKGAIEAVVSLAGHKMAETDPELGANLMFFFIRGWDELTETPDLDRLVPDLEPLVVRLKDSNANQYRFFRFDPDGAIKASFVFIRMDKALSDLPADELALAQAAEMIVLWSDLAFENQSPLGRIGDKTVLRPDVAGIISACYDPVMPRVARDPAHALRVSARLGAAL